MFLPPEWALRASKTHPESVVGWIKTVSGIGLWPSVLIVTGKAVIWVKRGLIRNSVFMTKRKSICSSDFITGVIWDYLYLDVDDQAFPFSMFRVSKEDRDEVYSLLFHLEKNQT